MFLMRQQHGWSLDELEGMIPWERQVYVTLYQQKMEEERLKAEARLQQINKTRR